MIKTVYNIQLKPGQRLRFVPIGDIHYDTPECDRDRLVRFVEWTTEQEKKGDLVRLVGLGDYLDFGSGSERARIMGPGALHETTMQKFDRAHYQDLLEFYETIKPTAANWLGLLTGHHYYLFSSAKTAGPAWKGKSSDAWIADKLGCDFWGDGVAYFRLAFRHKCPGMGCPHPLHLDVLCHHGGGGAQTPGGRVQKRIRTAEIAPTAHLVITGHDNAKLAYPRSGLDFDHGSIKRYVVGSGSFQRAYMEGLESGYAEKMGLVPADLGVTVIDIQIEERHGKWRVDYHASV